jgi:hypothetical protein
MIMKHLHTFESFLNEADAKDPKLVKGADITIEMDDEDGDFVAGDYRVTGLTRGGVMLDGMGKRNLQVTFGALSNAGYTVNESTVNEGVSVEAVKIHAMTGCGQDAAQNFIDENKIDPEKLLKYLDSSSTAKYDVRDYINAAKGTVGANERLRKNFIKKMQ